MQTVNATTLGCEGKWPGWQHKSLRRIKEDLFSPLVKQHSQNTPLKLCPGQRPAGPLETAYVVLQVAIAAWLGQQQLDDLHVPVLAGTHQGGGALVVLDVDVSPTGQQALHHVYPPMTDSQHEGCLSCLWEEMTADFRSTCWAGSV